MTKIGFRTLFVILSGVIFLPLVSLKHYSEALSGFISEPLYWASGFASLELSLLILLLKFKGEAFIKIVECLSHVLSFTYGVFITTVLALTIQKKCLDLYSIIVCVCLTLLMLLVDYASSKKVLVINSKFGHSINSKANRTANKALLIVMLIFCIAYLIFVYVK